MSNRRWGRRLACRAIKAGGTPAPRQCAGVLSYFSSRYHAAVNERGNQALRLQAGGEHPGAVFRDAIGSALGEREQGRGIESNRQRAVERIVDEYIVNQQ